jgi:hypothetical protein
MGNSGEASLRRTLQQQWLTQNWFNFGNNYTIIKNHPVNSSYFAFLCQLVFLVDRSCKRA